MEITNDALNCVTFNCNGYKGSSLYVKKLVQANDIVFLCEHWLQPKDIVTLEGSLDSELYWTHMKSSINPEENLKGRPFGGIGYICKKNVCYHYKSVKCENDHICVLQIAEGDSVKMTIIGVYMPYWNSSDEQLELYTETLDNLQSLVDQHGDTAPVLLMGDFNTVLPQCNTLTSQWFKKREFNRYSVLLYDFICLNDLYVANFISHQTVNHTYFKAGQRSYLDHILVPKSMHDDILSCNILSKEPDNVSDHYALSIRLKLSLKNIEKRLSEGMDNMISFPKTRWNDKESVACYQESLKDILVEYMRTETAINTVLNEDDAQEYVDSLCDKLAHYVYNASGKAFKVKLKIGGDQDIGGDSIVRWQEIGIDSGIRYGMIVGVPTGLGI